MQYYFNSFGDSELISFYDTLKSSSILIYSISEQSIYTQQEDIMKQC